MNRLLISSLCLGLMLGLASCLGIFIDRNGKFQKVPINLEAFNSDSDDYNSTLAMNRYGSEYLIFSSKRDRRDKFNLVLKPFELVYDDKTDKLNARIGGFNTMNIEREDTFFQALVAKVNQNCNILGPTAYSYNTITRGEAPSSDAYLLFFADDSEGNLQIKFVHNFNDNAKVEGPFEVSWLNSSQDDAYPTLSGDFSTLYFCSNRDGNFDIFEAALPTDKSQLLAALLSDQPRPITKNQRLSSPADDKCPHIVQSWPGNVMYLVSNRSGGYGGFDIYYAISGSTTSEGTQWSTPQNLGSRINTNYDEYRPITPRNGFLFDYHLGIFSSNRPGGKGGFDLYMVGFLKENETRP